MITPQQLVQTYGLIAAALTLVFGVFGIVAVIANRKNPIGPGFLALSGLLFIATIILFSIDTAMNLQNSLLAKIGVGLLRTLFPGFGL